MQKKELEIMLTNKSKEEKLCELLRKNYACPRFILCTEERIYCSMIEDVFKIFEKETKWRKGESICKKE